MPTTRRGRKAFAEKKVRWPGIELPESLATKVDLLLTDPLTGKVKYGARTQLFEQLLREWLGAQQRLYSRGTPAEEVGFTPDGERYSHRGPGDTPANE